MRLAARNEALQTATEQLQLKIQQKVRSNTGFLFVHGKKKRFSYLLQTCNDNNGLLTAYPIVLPLHLLTY